MAPKPSHSVCLSDDPVTFTETGKSFSAKAFLSLSPRPQIYIECTELQGLIHGYLLTNYLRGTSVPIELSTGEKLQVFPVSVSTGDHTSRLIPTHGPITALQTGAAVQIASFSVLNFPDFFDKTGPPYVIELPDEDTMEFLGHVQLEAPPWIVRITSVPNRASVKAALRSHGYAITHEGAAARLDGGTFSTNDATELFELLRIFLSFARGSRSGLATVTGFDVAGKRVWERWGAAGVEPWSAGESWFDKRHGEILAELFPEFWSRLQNTTYSDPIRMALEWYLISNKQENVHASIVLMHAALERLAYLAVDAKATSGDWISSALRKMSIDDRIPPEFSQTGFWKQYCWDHGPHALVSIRNDLVHSEMQRGALSVEEYCQANDLGLHYIELMLLHMFDYHGSYWNRLTQEFKPVPWAQTATPP